MEEPQRRSRLAIAAVISLVLGTVFRVWYVMVWHRPSTFLYSDMLNYVKMAKAMLNPKHVAWAGDTLYPPGMAVFLAGLYRLDSTWGVAVMVQTALAVLLPPLIALAARELYGDRVALLTLIMASVYFPNTEFFGFFLSEGPFLVLQFLCLWLLLLGLRARPLWGALGLGLLSGLAFGAASATRTVFVATGGLAGLWLLAMAWRGRRARTVAVLLVMALGGALPLGLSAERCTRLNEGEFCLASVNGAVNFLQGHSGRTAWFYFTDKAKNHDYHVASPTVLQKGYVTKAEYDFGIYDRKAIMAEAWKYIDAHPGEIALSSVEHVFDLYVGSVPWPSSHTPARRWIVFSEECHLVLLLLPAFFYLRRRARGLVRLDDGAWADGLALAPALSLIIVVFFTLGEPRYRIVVDGFTMMLAARWYLGERGGPRFCPEALNNEDTPPISG